MSRKTAMQSKSSIENGAQLWLPEVEDRPEDPREPEVPAESPQWRAAAFRFRLVGIADMRSNADVVNRPATPAATPLK